MSERNGDRSRFGRERKKKIFRRKRNRELCAVPTALGLRAQRKTEQVEGTSGR
jgi:hypothetical protein